MTFKKTTKTVVGSALTLGMGNAVIGSLPGGEKVSPIMDKAGNMVGVMSTTMYAKDTINMFAGMGKKKKKGKKKR